MILKNNNSQLGWVWNMTLTKLFLETLSTLGLFLLHFKLQYILKLLYTIEMFGRGIKGKQFFDYGGSYLLNINFEY